MEIRYEVVDQVFIAKEFAPNGHCDCREAGNEDGCPYCTPALIPAWKKSVEIEAELFNA